jgi:lipoyl(octanoyl) transferase
MESSFLTRHLGCKAYQPVFEQMHAYTNSRDEHSADEFWVVEHFPVYTQGQAGSPAHILDAGDIEVVQADRGGQVTYHGPGQLVVYVLLDLKRLGIGVKALVHALERSVIDYLQGHGIAASNDPKAPGVYVDGRKVAALGLRVRRGCSFHGLSMNVDMDLEPFTRINPCGYTGLEVTQLKDLGISTTVIDAGKEITHRLSGLLAEQMRSTGRKAAARNSVAGSPAAADTHERSTETQSGSTQ